MPTPFKPNVTLPPSSGNIPCTPKSSDISWMLISTVLVLGMLPGLAFFEAGLLRSKNTISISVQIFSGMTVLCTMWIAFGYSLSFSEGNAFIGDFRNAGLLKVSYVDCYVGTVIPSALHALFQMMFAAITPLLMTGAFAERLAWRPFIILMVCWEILVYYPVCHWMWGVDGWLLKMGAQDFAGGIVIHVTAGASSLVSVLMLGRRHDFHKHRGEAPYSSLPIACIGAALLWTGWFGFNGGSTFAAGELAVRVVINSQVAASVCSCCFLIVSLVRKGRPSMIQILNGAIAGLAGITPCAGYVSLGPVFGCAFVLAVTAQASMWLVKHKLQIDDALDVSCVHGVPGLIGALWSGFFADISVGGTLNGLAYKGTGKLLGANALACLVCGSWAAFWTFVILKVTSLFISLRVSIIAERAGLDIHEHNEVAWLSEKMTPSESFAVVPIDERDESVNENVVSPDTRRSNIERIQADRTFRDLIMSRAIAVIGGDRRESRDCGGLNATVNGSEYIEDDEYDGRHSSNRYSTLSRSRARASLIASVCGNVDGKVIVSADDDYQ